MSVQEMRSALHRMVDEADEERLRLMMHGWEGDPSATETGVSREEYNREIDESLAQHTRGQSRSGGEVLASARGIVEAAK